ncbi:glycosyltransferase [Chryseobacterium sp. ISL-6]|uniref:glycosyltransferase n=1 Tax=Chryseobacterium sp. ISL-6 TaxID=2819143 RepID=UPI001BE595C3|nr:glycosyltransferase [Chryseobacterium sp. ISL-6]MBT2621802.1 glycosyltransferase [Chryseobacterium sp. ISL-6]
MISIIISSYLPHYFSALENNIAETIGVPYEIIKIDNPGLMGICKAYNMGAEKAKYDYFLFIHEDILFHTDKWGEKLITHLNRPGTGVIGLAGSSYVPVAPSSWTVSEKHNFINILQGNKENAESYLINKVSGNTNPVYAVDGVFLGIKKENFFDFKFDEDINGFHGYDLDFTLRVSKRLQNYVIDNILIQHFSGGNLDKKWLDSNIKIKEKIGSDFQKTIDNTTEKKIFSGFLHKYFEYYPINRKTLLFTLKFYPYKYLDFRQHLFFIKKYFNYIRYASQINRKLKVDL